MPDVTHICPIFGCGKEIKGSEKDPDFCPHCKTPLWPLNEGHTGNDRDACVEFAKDYYRDGTDR